MVAIAGISYAYFSIQITGNETASSMRITTANLSLIYSDTAVISGDRIYPSWSQAKTITVTNNGNVAVKYNIIWKELLNQLTNNELVISGACTSNASGNSCENIPETVIPTNLVLATNIVIKDNIEIQPGETHTYLITVEFKETNSNQNYNQNKQFYGTLNIEEYVPQFKSVGIDETTGFPVIRSASTSTEEFYVISDTTHNGLDYDINKYKWRYI